MNELHARHPRSRLSSTQTAVVAMVLVAVASAACSDPIASNGGGADPSASGPVLVIVEGDPKPPIITVEDALTVRSAGDVVSVGGAIFVDAGGTVRLCDAIAESFPPQCGGRSVVIEGLDLGALDLEEASGVRWAESVSVLGRLE